MPIRILPAPGTTRISLDKEAPCARPASLRWQLAHRTVSVLRQAHPLTSISRVGYNSTHRPLSPGSAILPLFARRPRTGLGGPSGRRAKQCRPPHSRPLRPTCRASKRLPHNIGISCGPPTKAENPGLEQLSQISRSPAHRQPVCCIRVLYPARVLLAQGLLTPTPDHL
jgi:hypothetical protein